MPLFSVIIIFVFLKPLVLEFFLGSGYVELYRISFIRRLIRSFISSKLSFIIRCRPLSRGPRTLLGLRLFLSLYEETCINFDYVLGEFCKGFWLVLLREFVFYFFFKALVKSIF